MCQRTEQEIIKNWGTEEKALVSVCCETYNQQRYIREAIESFLMQETDFTLIKNMRKRSCLF